MEQLGYTLADKLQVFLTWLSSPTTQLLWMPLLGCIFIMATPKGYETEVGERGVTLSGGEKQRVAIARALLMDPKILILDDSTSSVDTETEYQIQKALDALLRDRTTFIITQRLSMIRKGNRIIVMDKGRVAEQGTHDELIRLNGIYRRIYDAQSGGRLSSVNGGGG